MHCWRVINGCVRTVTLLRDGRRAVGEFLLAGEYSGLDDIGTHNLAAETVSDAGPASLSPTDRGSIGHQ